MDNIRMLSTLGLMGAMRSLFSAFEAASGNSQGSTPTANRIPASHLTKVATPPTRSPRAVRPSIEHRRPVAISMIEAANIGNRMVSAPVCLPAVVGTSSINITSAGIQYADFSAPSRFR